MPAGHWEPDGERMDLRALFVNEGQLVGQLEKATAERLSSLVWVELTQDPKVLPGFSAVKSGRDSVQLIWQRPVVSPMPSGENAKAI